MAQLLYRIGVGGTSLLPALPGYPWRTVAAAFGASLNILAGQAMARKTSDGRMYPLNIDASDGTQTFGGFSQYSCGTDANGQVYLNIATSGGGGPDYFTGGGTATTPIVTGGVVDPNFVYTSNAANTTAVAEVDTITPAGSVTTGDLYSVYNNAGVGVEITVGATQTATGAVTLLKAAWNDDPACTAIATASGTATFILTGVTPGKPLNLTATAVGTGTVSLAITTAATSGVVAEVDTFTPSSVTTGDVTTVTITYPNLSTHAVTAAAIGGTATATTWTTAMKAAWNADPTAVSYATATGTTTFILTAAVPGNMLNLSAATVGTGTVAKVVTTATSGRNLADILPGNPGAHVLQPSGFWLLP